MLKGVTLILMVIFAVGTFVLPRRYFLVPCILAACFIPRDQRIIIMTLDFTVLRIIVLAAISRVLVQGWQRRIDYNGFDRIFFLWLFSGAVIYIVQWASASAVIFKAGVLFDGLLFYWLFRQAIKSQYDLDVILQTLAVSAIALVPFLAFEWLTASNPFAWLGFAITRTRIGQTRCEGPFPHALMLGAFWGAMVPIFIGSFICRGKKILYGAAILSSVFIIMSTASSTPLISLMAGLGFMAMFYFRASGGQIFAGLCASAVVVHFVRDKPVWHLIARANIFGGSTGWHRYFLIDKTIDNFSEWALLGTRDTAHWGLGLMDVTNQYILEGVRGGLVTMVIFIALLYWAVSIVGKFSLRDIPRRQQWFVWGICASILTHCMAFVAISYFGQIMMLFYLTMAIVALFHETALKSVKQRSTVRRQPNYGRINSNSQLEY